MIRYLADTSALIRIHQMKTSKHWLDASSNGMVAICDPVELEFLRGAAGGASRRRVQRTLREIYPWVGVPDDGWRQAIEIQDQLADRGQHKGASPVDLTVAATAARHRLVVLHDDNDYEAISRVTGLPVQRVTD